MVQVPLEATVSAVALGAVAATTAVRVVALAVQVASSGTTTAVIVWGFATVAVAVPLLAAVSIWRGWAAPAAVLASIVAALWGGLEVLRWFDGLSLLSTIAGVAAIVLSWRPAVRQYRVERRRSRRVEVERVGNP